MVSRICVLGATLEQAIWLLDLLFEANSEDIFRRRRDVAIMNDGTELIAMGLNDCTRLWGRHFDYVFYECGMLMPYYKKYGPAMEYLEQRCLVHTVVPREFQWCPVDC